MERLSEKQIVERIEIGELFEARLDSGACTIRVRNYVPAIFTAIHDGHEVAPALADKMLVNPLQRRFEEDPFTGDIIDAFSISLRMHHSRFYYDINRRPEACIYDIAWGQKVWNSELSAAEVAEILAHHRSYYRLLDALLDALERRFNYCVVYDLHSYNYSRINGSPPLFNIGTHYIDRSRYEPVLQHLIDQLNRIRLNDHQTRAVLDEVFQGMGYQAEHIHAGHAASLCIPLEIKKIFMNEMSLVFDSPVSEKLFPCVIDALASNAAYFADTISGSRLERTEFLSDQWAGQGR